MNFHLVVMNPSKREWDCPPVDFFESVGEARTYALGLGSIEAYWIRKLDGQGHYKTIEAKTVVIK